MRMLVERAREPRADGCEKEIVAKGTRRAGPRPSASTLIRRSEGRRRLSYVLATVEASAITRTPRPSIASIRIATRLTPDK
jgi:hypothetical protein